MQFLLDDVRWRPLLASGSMEWCSNFFVPCLKYFTETFEYPVDMNLNYLSEAIFASPI